MPIDQEKVCLKMLKSLDLKQIHKEYGRLVTTKFIRKGDIIFREKAMAVVSFDCCNICLNPGLIQCPKCAQPYCSPKCQKQDFDAHKITCGMNNPELDMLARTLIAMETAPKSRLELLDEMVSLRELISEQEVGELVSLVELITGKRSFKVSKSEMMKLLSKFRFNNFRILDEEMFDIAQGLFPLASKINHSCAPNCLSLFNKDEVIIKAVMDIHSSTELTISYIDPLTKYQTRQDSLKNGYRFECCCDYCTLQLPIQLVAKLDTVLDLNNGKMRKGVEIVISRIFEQYQSSNYSIQQCLTEIDDTLLSVNLYSAVTRLMYKEMEVGNTLLARECAKFALFFLLCYYPQYHPLIGIQAKLLIELQKETTPLLAHLATWANLQ